MLSSHEVSISPLAVQCSVQCRMLASCMEPLTGLQESMQGLEVCLLELIRIESYPEVRC